MAKFTVTPTPEESASIEARKLGAANSIVALKVVISQQEERIAELEKKVAAILKLVSA